MSQAVDCIVVGAGLAGLACAHALERVGKRVLVVEAADRVGGRVATDSVEGFRVDRGFQVYLDAYPAVGSWICPDCNSGVLRLGHWWPSTVDCDA